MGKFEAGAAGSPPECADTTATPSRAAAPRTIRYGFRKIALPSPNSRVAAGPDLLNGERRLVR